MKKFFLFFLSILSICTFTLNKPNVVNAEIELSLNAPSACLMEPNSKTILYEKNKDRKLYPASMTKMMGLSLVLEEINKGSIKWEDTVTCSSYASSMGGTQIYLEEGEKMPIVDLFKAVAINSANDAIVALMEHLYGTKEGFIKKMNSKAKELGMINTNFNNATGFDDENHYTTAYDMALLGSYLVSFGEDILKFTSLKEAYIRENSSSPFWLVNTNKLLRSYEGMDGLKTGYTNKAGYNLTATAKRNEVRLISVVMNEESIANRSKDTTSLLNYGFSLLRCENLFVRNAIVKEVCLDYISENLTPLIVKDDVNVYLFKDEKKEDVIIELILNDLTLPIEENELVGCLKITTPKGLIFTYDVYSKNNVSKTNFFSILFENIKLFFA